MFKVCNGGRGEVPIEIYDAAGKRAYWCSLSIIERRRPVGGDSANRQDSQFECPCEYGHLFVGIPYPMIDLCIRIAYQYYQSNLY
jgi:hypothetical protein